MNIQKKSSLQKSQHGAATILMAVVLLFAITIVSIFTARTTIMEQTISGNEYRGKQAFEAAEAGLQAGIAYYNNGGIDQNVPPNTIDGVTDVFLAKYIDTDPDDGTDWDDVTYTYLDPGDDDYLGPQSGTTSYHFAFCDPNANIRACIGVGSSVNNCPPPPDPTLVKIYACGWSDDRTAVRTVSQMVRVKPVLPGIPQAPLISRGITVSGGSFTVVNNYTNTTIWSGSDVEDVAFGNFTTKIRVDGAPDIVSTKKTASTFTLGPDVISNDPNISTATATEYFFNFFGDTIDNVAAKADLTTIPNTNAESLNKLIYISGNLTLDGSTPNLGSLAEPVILVVNGTLTLKGNVHIYGVVYAVNMDGVGNPTIHGSMVVENSPTNNGNVTIEYEPTTISNTSRIGSEGSVSGSWHDWL